MDQISTPPFFAQHHLKMMPSLDLMKKYTSSFVDEEQNRDSRLLLFKKKIDLKTLIDSMPRNYLSRVNRELLLAALKVYDQVFCRNSLDLMFELTKPTKHYFKIDTIIQNKIVCQINELFEKQNDVISNFKPNCDDERFELMVDSGHVLPNMLDVLFQLEIGSVEVFGRKFMVHGQTNRELFFSNVKGAFGFESPELFFDFTEDASK